MAQIPTPRPPKYPSVPLPTNNPDALYDSVLALKQVVEALIKNVDAIQPGISEAPIDGKNYARKNGTWVELP